MTLKIGDRVKINSNCTVERWIGLEGTIYRVGNKLANIALDTNTTCAFSSTDVLELEFNRFTIIDNQEEEKEHMEFKSGMVLYYGDRDQTITLKDKVGHKTWNVEEPMMGVFTEDYLEENYEVVEGEKLNLKFKVGDRIKWRGRTATITKADQYSDTWTYATDPSLMGMDEGYLFCKDTIEDEAVRCTEFIVGDVAKVIDNVAFHAHKIGDRVVVAHVDTTEEHEVIGYFAVPEDEYTGELTQSEAMGGGSYWVHGHEIALIKDEPTPEVPLAYDADWREGDTLRNKATGVVETIDDYDAGDSMPYCLSSSGWLYEEELQEFWEKVNVDDSLELDFEDQQEAGFDGWTVGKRVYTINPDGTKTFDCIIEYDAHDERMPYRLNNYGWVHALDEDTIWLLVDQPEGVNIFDIAEHYDASESFEFADTSFQVSFNTNNDDEDVINVISFDDHSLELALEFRDEEGNVEAVSIDLSLEAVTKLSNALNAHVNLSKF